MRPVPDTRPSFVANVLLILAFIATAVSGLGAQASPAPQAVIQRAVDAMGGEVRWREVRNRRLQANSMAFALGQVYSPNAQAPAIGTGSLETFDHQRGISWIQNTAGAGGGTRPTFIFDHANAALRLNDTTVVATQPSFAAMFDNTERRVRHFPDRLLLALLQRPASALRALRDTVRHGRTQHRVEASIGDETLVLSFDAVTYLMSAIETDSDDPVLGRRRETREYSQWTLQGQVLYPREERELVNGAYRHIRVIAAAQFNVAAVDTLPGPPRQHARPQQPVDSAVVTDVAPGVVRIESRSLSRAHAGGVPYFTTAIRQDNSVLLFELPVDDERTSLVLDAVRKAFPDAVARTFIVSHWHFDHVGGSRAGFAAGLSAIAPRELVPLLDRVGLRAGEPAVRRRSIKSVDDSMVVGQGDNRVVLYRVPTLHSSPMLVAFVPTLGLLIESDMVGLALPLQRRELREFVAARGLAVTHIVGAHDKVITWDDLVRPSR